MNKLTLSIVAAFVLLAQPMASAIASPLVNGSFETGDFSGFSRSGFFNDNSGGPSTGGPNYATFLAAQAAGTPKADTNAVEDSQTTNFDGSAPASSTPIGPTDGRFLAFVSNQTSAGNETLTGSSISQMFTVAPNATSLSFDVGLLNDDSTGSFVEYDDFGGVALLSGMTLLDQFNLDLDPNSTADAHVTADTDRGGFFNGTAWLSPSFDLSGLAGQPLTFVAYSTNYGGDNSIETRLLLDNIRVNAPTAAVPEPPALGLLGLGAILLAGGAGWRRRSGNRAGC